jgi:hypothetical protein
MNKKPLLATLLFGALVATGSTGCSRFKEPGLPAMGTVTFALSATGASGTVYRLRSAVFMVTGPETKTITGPTDPADTLAAITTQFLPGQYSITLETGWQMWVIPTSGSPVAVPSTLISPATITFNVTSGQDSKVMYQFDVSGIPNVPGTLTIGIGVTEVDGGAAGATGAGTAGTTGAGGASGAGVAGASGGSGGAADGSAGTGGADGAASLCGTAAQQCNSPAAFADNTCDPNTCMNIPIVCGNYLVQPGEQCDDGPAGSLKCTTNCTLINPDGGSAGAGGAGGSAGAGGAGGSAGTSGAAGSAGAGGTGGASGAGGSTVSACGLCEQQGTNSGVCIGTKVVKSSSVVGCAGLTSPTDQANCMTLLNCLQMHPMCSISPADPTVNNDPTACFCGMMDAATCAGANPATSTFGVCAPAYFALYGGATLGNVGLVLGDFFNRATATGMANNLYACDVTNNCQSLCP